MKTDKHLTRYPLTQEQAFFAELWFNLVHEHSLDSYRVRVMNVRNTVRELVKIYWDSPAKVEEQKEVRLEAYELLKDDQVLKTPPFKECVEQLLELIKPQGELEKGKEDGGRPKQMLRYLLAELQPLIEVRYVEGVVQYLRAILIEGQKDDLPIDERLNMIERSTASLVSVLLDDQASLESVFMLYAQVLVPRAPKPGYQFEKRFGLLETLLRRQPRVYRIVVAVDNVSTPHDFPNDMGGIAFLREAPFSAPANARGARLQSIAKYLEASPKRLFTVQTVKSHDPRAAGTRAYDRLNDVLNLVRFEYERNRIVLHEYFMFDEPEEAGPSIPKLYPMPVIVPNPTASMDGLGLQSFVKSVDELVAGGGMGHEGRDRVLSAFRLYRTGLDANTLENKLTNWWTALEYLVRGSEGSGGIGKAVEVALAPVLCNTYLEKHLSALKAALLEIGVNLVDPANTQTITLRSLKTTEFLALLRRPDLDQPLRQAFVGHPFGEKKLSDLKAMLTTPQSLLAVHNSHERRLKWQIQRLYRARCDIVHSAERVVNAALLCANLEFYLKVTLNALLKALRDVPTLSGPKEFFDRQAYKYEQVKLGLSAGNELPLVNTIDR